MCVCVWNVRQCYAMNPIGRHLWVVLTAFVLLSKLLFVLKITIVISSFREWELSSQSWASYRDLRSCRCGSIWPCEDSSRGVSIPSILQGRSESENGIQEVKVNRWLMVEVRQRTLRPASMGDSSAKGTCRVASSHNRTAKLHISADLTLISLPFFWRASGAIHWGL